MLSNKEVSSVFKMLAGLMELHGENDFKTKSYSNAAFQIGRLHEPVMELSDEQLTVTPGIGKSVFSKIVELKTTGTIQALENLYQVTPPGIIEMLRIKGLGGKKVAVIWKELGVETVGELLYACNENRLAMLKGFGEKTQQSVIQSIEYYQSNLGKFHFADLAHEANEILAVVEQVCGKENCSLTGALRRKCNVVEYIEIIIRDKMYSEKIKSLSFIQKAEESANGLKGTTVNDLPFLFYFSTPDTFEQDLFQTTGNEDHVKMVLEKVAGKPGQSEEEIYQLAGYPYINPEWRDVEPGFFKINESDLIRDEDIRGVVHNHSTWSDGKNTIEEMAAACRQKGYEYLVLSDHSKTAVYAGGLTESRIQEQQKEIDNLNQSYTGFRIFKSIECDILNDGRMDYDDVVLQSFDLVIASIHQNLKMDEEKATARLIKAIENPFTRILGHMTGRLILTRPGYPVDHKKVIDACAANKVVIEINANPWRLDIDYSFIPYALEKGVMISINPDAHSVEGIDDIHWGVVSARKGGLTKTMTLNAKALDAFTTWINEK